jgi:hypothetical protein
MLIGEKAKRLIGGSSDFLGDPPPDPRFLARRAVAGKASFTAVPLIYSVFGQV